MKKLFICMFAIVSIICACTETEMWNEKMDSVNTSNDITIEAVKKSAMDFINDIQPITRGESFDIASVYAWRSDEIFPITRGNDEGELPDTMLYIVNFTNNNGYLLLSAKEPNHEVIAYVEEGNMTPTTTIDNPGMQLFLKRTREYINRLGLNPLEPIDTIPLMPGELRLLIPLMKTSWHQFSPFNDQCPVINGIPCKAGCGPIATAQIVAYHKSPASYNNYVFPWDSISVNFRPTTELGKTGAAYLVHQIGLLEYADYHPEGTGVTTYGITNAFNVLGYSYSTDDYSYNLCKQSIDANRPILITGTDEVNNGCHAWVIDDYYDRIEAFVEHLADGGTFIRYEITGRFVHCNWGWNDNSNGYFLSGVFDTQQKVYEADNHYGELQQGSHYYNFTTDLSMFYNIHPNN